MDDDNRYKLINLGAEVLADALLKLAVSSDTVSDTVDRLVATPRENARRFKNKLAGLKRAKRFVEWKNSSSLARTLESLLDDLKVSITDPFEGFQLITKFYETDGAILGCCDDSSGHVGSVFKYQAKDLFVMYASGLAEKEMMADIVLKLNQNDDYGVRRVLIDCASEYLPEPIIRAMINTLQEGAGSQKEEHCKRKCYRQIESLARQIKDAKLFEKARIASWEKLSTAACIDIAKAYLESDEVETAYSWLLKIPKEDTYDSYNQEKLLMEIYRRQGNSQKVTELLWKKFKSYHSIDTLQELLDDVGHDSREKVIKDEIPIILNGQNFNTSDAEFLVAIDRMSEAEEYIVKRSELINGNSYDTLLPLVKAMESSGCYLASSLLYRSLLISILERGYTKAYSYGTEYLKKLDSLAEHIIDWQGNISHEEFKTGLKRQHGRKIRFWSGYDNK